MQVPAVHSSIRITTKTQSHPLSTARKLAQRKAYHRGLKRKAAETGRRAEAGPGWSDTTCEGGTCEEQAPRWGEKSP